MILGFILFVIVFVIGVFVGWNVPQPASAIAFEFYIQKVYHKVKTKVKSWLK